MKTRIYTRSTEINKPVNTKDGKIIISTVPGSFKIDRERYFNLPAVKTAIETMKESEFFPKVNFPKKVV